MKKDGGFFPRGTDMSRFFEPWQRKPILNESALLLRAFERQKDSCVLFTFAMGALTNTKMDKEAVKAQMKLYAQTHNDAMQGAHHDEGCSFSIIDTYK